MPSLITRARSWGRRRSGQLRARACGVALGRECACDLDGVFEIAPSAQVRFGDRVALQRGFRITAGENARITIGSGVRIRDNFILEVLPGATVEIGDGCFLNHNVSITAQSGIVLGEVTLLGPYCYLIDHDHMISPSLPIREQDYVTSPISVGSDAWLGVGATILKGVTIGDGAVIAARAVVNKDVADNEIWAGIPAKRIKTRTD